MGVAISSDNELAAISLLRSGNSGGGGDISSFRVIDENSNGLFNPSEKNIHQPSRLPPLQPTPPIDN
jgi:hypothetical protein